MDTNPDADRARELLERTPLHNVKEHNLAAAQVHATLAMEAAVRELIDVTQRAASGCVWDVAGNPWPSGEVGTYIYDPRPM